MKPPRGQTAVLLFLCSDWSESCADSLAAMGLDAMIYPKWAPWGLWFPMDKAVTKRSIYHLVATWKKATTYPEKRGSQADVVQGACADIPWSRPGLGKEGGVT